MGGPALIDGKAVKETDNFHVCKIKLNDVEYPSSEHYYQCMKCVNKADHDFVLKAKDARDSWRRGNLKRIKIRKDWDIVRVDIMYDGNLAKFQQNREYKRILTSTKGEIKCRGSSEFWNKWNAIILERIREDLRDEETQDKSKLAHWVDMMEQFKVEMKRKIQTSGKKKKKKKKKKIVKKKD